jgi:hypothetical protein
MKPDVCDCSLCCDRRRSVLVLVLMRIGPPRVKGSSKKLSCESTALHECYMCTPYYPVVTGHRLTSESL